MTRAEDRLILSHAESKRSSPWQKTRRVAVIPESAAAARIPRIRRRGRWTNADEVLDPPAVSGQYDSAVAVTSVAMFQACPRRYYLSRYLGLEPVADRPGTGAVELGLDVHAALAGEEIESAGGERIGRALPIERTGTPRGVGHAHRTRIRLLV